MLLKNLLVGARAWPMKMSKINHRLFKQAMIIALKALKLVARCSAGPQRTARPVAVHSREADLPKCANNIRALA